MYIKPLGLPYYFCSFSIYIYIYIGCLNIYGTHVTANNTTTDNVVSFFVSDLKIVHYNNY